MYGAKVSIERGRMGGLEEPRPWTGVTKCGQQWKAMVGESERAERERNRRARMRTVQKRASKERG